MQQSFILTQNESRNNQVYNVLGMDVCLKVAGADTGGQLSMFSAEYKIHQGPPLHQHNADEVFYITGGEFLFQTGDIKCNAMAGDIVFIPRNMPHAFVTISAKASMLFMVTPTDTVEALFTKLDSFTTPPSVDEVVLIHEELGLKIVGPPLKIE